MKMIRFVGFIAFLVVAFSACATPFQQLVSPTTSSLGLASTSVTFTPSLPVLDTLSPTNSPVTLPTLTPVSTLTPVPQPPPPTPLPTETWVFHPAGDVIAPILLYHHVVDSAQPNRYYISVADFRTQIKTLKRLGYTGITISTLVQAIESGVDLPARPVVITFDDGNEDIYQNAYPVLKELGFVGTFYIIVGYLDTYQVVTTDQLKKMAANGWEIGSHSMTHVDVRNPSNGLRWEAYQSRIELEKKIGVPVKTFAYPYGLYDSFVSKKMKDYGYDAAVGLGTSTRHGLSDLFSLSRIEVESNYDLARFGKLLPWTDIPTTKFP